MLSLYYRLLYALDTFFKKIMTFWKNPASLLLSEFFKKTQ